MQIVVPRGRLFEESLSLLRQAGIQSEQPDGRELVIEGEEHTFLLAKAREIPVYVEKGVDIGITGKDVVEERGSDVFIPLRLPFGKCRLSIAVPEDRPGDIRRLEGCTVATEYPNVTDRFFRSEDINVEVLKVDGSTELAPRAGIAEAIVDIVETGRTLRANCLKEIYKIMDISALLLVNRISQKTRFEEINGLLAEIRNVIDDGS